MLDDGLVGGCVRARQRTCRYRPYFEGAPSPPPPPPPPRRGFLNFSYLMVLGSHFPCGTPSNLVFILGMEGMGILGLAEFSSCFSIHSHEVNNFEQDGHFGQVHLKSGSFPGFLSTAAPNALEDMCTGHTSSDSEGADFDRAALGSSDPDDASSEVHALRCCCSRRLGGAFNLDLRAAALLVSKVLVRECGTSKFLDVFLRKISDFLIACATECAIEGL